MTIVNIKHNAGRMDNMNENLEKYLEGYCRKHKCSVEEALTHKMVQTVAKEYERKESSNVTKTEINAGCGSAQIGGDCK